MNREIVRSCDCVRAIVWQRHADAPASRRHPACGRSRRQSCRLSNRRDTQHAVTKRKRTTVTKEEDQSERNTVTRTKRQTQDQGSGTCDQAAMSSADLDTGAAQLREVQGQSLLRHRRGHIAAGTETHLCRNAQSEKILLTVTSSAQCSHPSKKCHTQA